MCTSSSYSPMAIFTQLSKSDTCQFSCRLLLLCGVLSRNLEKTLLNRRNLSPICKSQSRHFSRNIKHCPSHSSLTSPNASHRKHYHLQRDCRMHWDALCHFPNFFITVLVSSTYNPRGKGKIKIILFLAKN